MSIVLTRVDNRLIHGQVLEAWLPFIHANCIVVANDEISLSPLKRMMMEASVPSRVRVEIGSVGEIAQLFESGEFDEFKVLLLFATTSDCLEALHAGLKYERLNLGNLHAGHGKAQFSCTVFLDPEDVENLELIDQAGVEISARCIPADTERNWRRLIPSKRVES
ncbi:PTS sugar transporter subunit IIB [Geopsychrobacter electrodiphilus]|uniref:PTS sugar transporter subunit IIB n=1 Tax=Geopsychrobacter electrodiphilus TaxID=225196 RepID=UPI00035CE960|nr:PTS sugar transporter subunit IIB [Geopsychrobacter electrodiphilus]